MSPHKKRNKTMSDQPAKPCSTNESQPLPASKPKPRCSHFTANGRRCRLEALDPRSGLCFRHLQLTQAALAGNAPAADPKAVARELLSGVADFSRAECINRFLGNLVKQLAYQRIARTDAIALAYIGQLLLNSLPAIKKQSDDERHSAGCADLLQTLIQICDDHDAEDNASQTSTPSAENFKVDWH
jgi:hypothetical protein